MLAYDPGMGKTACAILAAQALEAHQPIEPALIIGPNSSHGVWRRELRKWGDDPDPRRWTIVNAHHIKDVLDRKWRLIILDESHMYRNRQTRTLYKTVKQLNTAKLGGTSRPLFQLTGSPIIKHPTDLWTQLNLLDPKTWSSFWRFVDEYFFVEDNPFGGVNILHLKDPTGLRNALRPYMLRKTKKANMPHLPPKVRRLFPVTMTGAQRRVYNDITDDLMAEVSNGQLLLVPTTMARMTRLRQLLVCPRLIGLEQDGAAIAAVKEQYDVHNEPIAIFTPFAEALPHFARVFDGADVIATVRGGMSPERIDEEVQRYENADTTRKVFLCSVQMGISFTVTSTSTAYFLGYDWSPDINIQAEDRLHREGQRNSVYANYVIHEGTVDEHVGDVLDGKASLASLVLRPQEFLAPR